LLFTQVASKTWTCDQKVTWQYQLIEKKRNLSFKKRTRSSTKGFVKISANWSLVLMNTSSTSFLFTWSRIKWCFISMCLDLECWMRFFDKFMTLVLSHNIWIFAYLSEKSSNWFLIYNTWQQQFAAEMYSASVVDRAIVFCFRQHQLTKASPTIWHASLVLFLSILSPA